VLNLTGNLITGGSLTVSNCIVQNMVQDQGGDPNTGNGILLEPTYGGILDIAITNTTVSNNFPSPSIIRRRGTAIPP
jgi:hypothetical protein